MQYKYETESRNYEDFAGGRVLYHQKGATAFPVRLASEIFLRSTSYLEAKGVDPPFTLYDPCCGGAYFLTVIGFLHGNCIAKILASDINKDMVGLAERNLSLLTEEGINRRIEEIEEYIRKYNKDSHRSALASALRLKTRQEDVYDDFVYHCFTADALKAPGPTCPVDVLITDLPYGDVTEWSSTATNPVERFLNTRAKVLKPTSVAAIVTAKKQKIEHRKYNRMKHFTIGKRRVSFLEPQE